MPLILTGQMLFVILTFGGTGVAGLASDAAFCWSVHCRADREAATAAAEAPPALPALDPAFRPFCEVVPQECSR